MELEVRRRVVTEVVSGSGYEVYDRSKNVRPSPLECSILIKGSSDRRTEDCKWNGSGQDYGVERTTLLVWNQFSDSDGEGQLASSCKSVQAVCTDQHVHRLGRGSNDISDECKNRGSNKEPSSTEDFVVVSLPLKFCEIGTYCQTIDRPEKAQW